MQTIYAMHQSGSENLEKEEKFLNFSLEIVQDLFLIMLSTLTEIRNKEAKLLEISKKKHLATKEDLNPNIKLANNKVLLLLEDSKSLNNALKDRKIKNWKDNDDYINLLLNEVKESELYQNYMLTKENTFDEDIKFVMEIFSEVIAPNDKLYDYLEDLNLTWVDDIPLVNTSIMKHFKLIRNQEEYYYAIPNLYRDLDDKEFAFNLFRKTVLNEVDLAKEFQDKTPNWDSDRIAHLDTIMLKMAICEFFHFPSIPLKVTINEYLEISKEYSTPKSSNFINGILDNLIKELAKTDKIVKSGRGLL